MTPPSKCLGCGTTKDVTIYTTMIGGLAIPPMPVCKRCNGVET